MDGDSEAPAVRVVLASPAFWVGVALLVIWGIAIVFVFKVNGPCDGERDCELALFYWLLVGILPGAYLVAGLLAPARPFLTGVLLAAVHVAIAAVTALRCHEPQRAATRADSCRAGRSSCSGFASLPSP